MSNLPIIFRLHQNEATEFQMGNYEQSARVSEGQKERNRCEMKQDHNTNTSFDRQIVDMKRN